jgi:hypothetical protein
MRRTTTLCVMGLVLAGSYLPCLGQEPVSLWIHPGARARALGGAYVAVASDAECLYWNPAGLTALRGQWSLASSYSQPRGGSFETGLMGIAIARGINTRWAVGGSLVRFSNAVEKWPDPDTPEWRDYQPRELVAAAGVAARLAPPVSVGLTVKYINYEYLPDWLEESSDPIDNTLEGWGLDLGVLASFADAPVASSRELRFGVVLANLGPALQADFIDSEQDGLPLPRQVRLGAAGRLGGTDGAHVTACIDYMEPLGSEDDVYPEPQGAPIEVGAEMAGSARCGAGALTGAIRIGYGYDSYRDVQGLAFGVGLGALSASGRVLSLDYASSPTSGDYMRPWEVGVHVAF